MKVCRTTWWMVVMLNMFKFSWLDRCSNPSTSFQLVSSSTNLDKLHVSFHQNFKQPPFYPGFFPEANVKPLMVGAVGRPWIKHSSQCPRLGRNRAPDLRLFPFLGNELTYPNQTESLENHHLQQKYLWDVQSNFEDCSISQGSGAFGRDVSKSWHCMMMSDQEKIHCVNMDSKLVIFVFFQYWWFHQFMSVRRRLKRVTNHWLWCWLVLVGKQIVYGLLISSRQWKPMDVLSSHLGGAQEKKSDKVRDQCKIRFKFQ